MPDLVKADFQKLSENQQVQRHVQRGKGEDSMRNLEDYTKLNPDVQ
jgi:cold shock CspA family protein